MAEGNNPVNNMPALDDSILNNSNVVRCLYFVKDVLEKVYENNGRINGQIKKRYGRAEDMFPLKILSEFQYIEDKSINKVLKQIYEAIDDETIKQIGGKAINEWLIKSGYITEIFNNEVNKTIKVPTEKGTQIGLRSERIVNMYGQVYYTIIYNKKAQEFLINNFEKFLNGEIIENE